MWAMLGILALRLGKQLIIVLLIVSGLNSLAG